MKAIEITREGITEPIKRLEAQVELHKARNELVNSALSVANSVIKSNSEMIYSFKHDIEHYIDPGKYNGALFNYPGGPTHFDIRQTGYEFIEKGPLSIRPINILDAQNSDRKQEIFFPTFSSETSNFNLKDTLFLRQSFIALDVIFDHHQVNIEDERAAVRIIQTEHGKTIVFLG